MERKAKMMKSKSKSNLMLSTLLLLIVLVCLGFLTMSVEAKQLNKPPKGFVALFNGKDLTGWKGLVGSPKSRREMSKEELAKAQAKADEDMRINWKVVDGALFFNGKGHSLCTARDYSDFEMLVDWKIEKGGDRAAYIFAGRHRCRYGTHRSEESAHRSVPVDYIITRRTRASRTGSPTDRSDSGTRSGLL
jgi:hypothetical protein